jgi:hypothetical protein
MAVAQVDTADETGRAEIGSTLPERFQPRFWSECDNRMALVRAIKERVTGLKVDANADSVQKEVLCERAVFLLTILETHEVNAIEGGKLDLGAYVQGVNSLMGLLRLLGLERKAKKVGLSEYVAGGRA